MKGQLYCRQISVIFGSVIAGFNCIYVYSYICTVLNPFNVGWEVITYPLEFPFIPLPPFALSGSWSSPSTQKNGCGMSPGDVSPMVSQTYKHVKSTSSSIKSPFLLWLTISVFPHFPCLKCSQRRRSFIWLRVLEFRWVIIGTTQFMWLAPAWIPDPARMKCPKSKVGLYKD